MKFATYEDLFDLPEHIVGEIINGRVVTHPRPAPKHARAYSSIGVHVGGPYDFSRGGPGGWWILSGCCSPCWKTTPPSPSRPSTPSASR